MNISLTILHLFLNRHWSDFGECSKNEVESQCGKEAGEVSEFLHNIHSSYFSTYSSCIPSQHKSTECWYDTVLDRVPKQKPIQTLNATTSSTVQPSSSTTSTTTTSTTTSTTETTLPKKINKDLEHAASEGEDVPINDDSNEANTMVRQHDIRSAVHEQFQQDSKAGNSSVSLFQFQYLTWIVGLFIYATLSML